MVLYVLLGGALVALPVLIVVALRLSRRRHEFSRLQGSLFTTGRQLLALGAIAWLVMLVAVNAALRRSPGAGASEVAWLLIATTLLLVCAAIAFGLVVVLRSRTSRPGRP